ncbi:MAG TPA: iron ABC transporter permease [Solirubrobacteraceae bacterium]|nr:iron ABC transporter permease [Solirubrobacteraceae bacterium]
MASWLPAGGPAPRARRPGRERLIVGAGALVALGLLAPLVLLGLDARDAGWGEIHRVLFRSRSVFLLRHTVVLCLLVAVFAAVIGTAAAWCTERSGLPARRVWTVLLVLPVAIPDFVVGYAWHSFAPALSPLLASTLVMTLGTYPLVYLPVAAALRRADPAMEETAYSLGVGPVRTFFRVTLPLVRTAVLGGCVLVVLTVVSEYGAFEILRYQTFTTEIFTEFQFDSQAAGALSIPLVMLGLLVLSIDALVPRRTAARTAPRRVGVPGSSVRVTMAMVLVLTALVGLGVGVPIGTLAYWMAQSHQTTLPAAATLASATWTTLKYSAIGAGVAVALALPVAMMSFRRTTAPRLVIDRATFVTQAVPGVVVALSLVFFATYYAYGLYQSSLLLVAAYVVLHFPLALVCVKSSVAQVPARLTDVGRSLGVGPMAVFARVTVPLLAPGLIAGFCLVFLTAVTELTATLVLAPIGVQTLATQFWAFQSEVAYGAAAPYALVMVGLAAIPGAVLGLWFDRERYTRRPVPIAA